MIENEFNTMRNENAQKGTKHKHIDNETKNEGTPLPSLSHFRNGGTEKESKCRAFRFRGYDHVTKHQLAVGVLRRGQIITELYQEWSRQFF